MKALLLQYYCRPLKWGKVALLKKNSQPYYYSAHWGIKGTKTNIYHFGWTGLPFLFNTRQLSRQCVCVETVTPTPSHFGLLPF